MATLANTGIPPRQNEDAAKPRHERHDRTNLTNPTAAIRTRAFVEDESSSTSMPQAALESSPSQVHRRVPPSCVDSRFLQVARRFGEDVLLTACVAVWPHPLDHDVVLARASQRNVGHV